jgi:isopentenyldiphosphate isomerase
MTSRPSVPDFPQNLNELFDVLDAEGTPFGYAKARGDVHRDGDWHRSVHVWIYGLRGQEPFVLFQRRSMMKDTAPGRLDPTVGGHYGHGETIEDVWREVYEEIGVEAVADEMRFAGVRVRSGENESGIIDREIQDIYLWRRDDPLESYAPNPAELAGLVEIPVENVLGIYSGSPESFAAAVIDAETGKVSAVELEASEVYPSIDRYPYRVAVAVLAALRGDEWIAV